MKEIWIINGPNLNLLGKRQPELYGKISFENYLVFLRKKFPDYNILYYQSNHEGSLIDKLQEIGFTAKGIIFNPAAYTHTSIALADTIAAIPSPVIEVHISNINKREAFRKTSYIKEHCIHAIIGLGIRGYEEAVKYFIEDFKIPNSPITSSKESNKI